MDSQSNMQKNQKIEVTGLMLRTSLAGSSWPYRAELSRASQSIGFSSFELSFYAACSSQLASFMAFFLFFLKENGVYFFLFALWLNVALFAILKNAVQRTSHF